MSSTSCRQRGWWVDSDLFAKRAELRDTPNETFGVSGPGGFQDALSLREHRRCSVMVGVVRDQHGNAAMAVLGVVPPEERPAEDGGLLDAEEATGEAGVVLERLELRLRERIVIGGLRGGSVSA